MQDPRIGKEGPGWLKGMASSKILEEMKGDSAGGEVQFWCENYAWDSERESHRWKVKKEVFGWAGEGHVIVLPAIFFLLSHTLSLLSRSQIDEGDIEKGKEAGERVG